MLQGKRDLVLLLPEHLRLRRLLLSGRGLLEPLRIGSDMRTGCLLHLQQRSVGVRMADDVVLVRCSVRYVVGLRRGGLFPQRRLRHLAARTQGR